MTYVFPFNAPIKLSTSEFAQLSVTSSYADLIATASVAGTVLTPVPGDDTECVCPNGYIPCPNLSVPGYDLVCLQVASCDGGGTRVCPDSIPVPTTSTTTTSTTSTSTTTTSAPTTTTTSTTTTTEPPGICYTAHNTGINTSGTISWTDPTLGAQSTTIGAGVKLNICTTTIPTEVPAADVIFYNCGGACATDAPCTDCSAGTTTTTTIAPTTTTTTTTTTTAPVCNLTGESITGPSQASSTAACALGDTEDIVEYTDGSDYYSASNCNGGSKLVGYYKYSTTQYVYYDGVGGRTIGSCAATTTTTTTTTACSTAGQSCTVTEDCCEGLVCQTGNPTNTCVEI